ncbi:PadR family transcriptional regulator [Salarchaeum sp. JOR-1]|uniref:PadR family transcriptional regulator n=1 Tax=Salarchaeum sp. JOR-1 TaxID=2599399 RepID=UPI0011984E12|nr:winged helix-turn-helix domain-containing protein [Salarchaeum sp. JOR-1]QDX39528.1 PadR family transcriptional regulator [Salarchaeum sp. JOR-1]
MDDLLEELTADIDADTALSLTVSDLESMIDSDGTSAHEDQPHDEGAAQRYTDTPLTDDAVAPIDGWVDNDQLHTISDEIVTEHIDAILLLLIAVRDGACGKDLLQDIRRLFGTDLSPGTVYPHLSDLADDGILEMQKLSKRKVYRLSDPDVALTRVDHAAEQLLLFSVVLKEVLTDCNANQSQSQSHRSEIDE